MANEPVVVPNSSDLRRWYTPKEVRARAVIYVGEEYADQAVWNRIRSGLIQVVAATASRRKNYEDVETFKIPQHFPDTYFNLHDKIPDKFWSGDIQFAYDATPRTMTGNPDRPIEFGEHAMMYVEAFGIRLNPGDVDHHWPPPQPVEASTSDAPPPAKHPGGPKPKPWWDDFWVAMGHHIYAGNIQPQTRQADVAKLMLEWTATHGHEMGDSTAKSMARKLLAQLQADVKN